MNDVISRQAAIDALESGKDKNIKGVIGGFYNAIIQNDIDKLRKLPSAQAEIVRCKDCKHYNGEDRDICCPLADYAQSKCGADWFCADGERRADERSD